MLIRSMASLLILIPLCVHAQEVSPAIAGAMNTPMSVQPIANDTKLIEEKSLIPWVGMDHPDTRMGLSQSSSGADGDPRKSGTIFQDAAESRSNGIRLYGFNLAPMEKLLVKLECENSNKIVMKFAPPTGVNPMTAQYRKANMSPRPLRCRRIAIQNVTDKPYQVVLSLLGQANYSYRMVIERQ